MKFIFNSTFFFIYKRFLTPLMKLIVFLFCSISFAMTPGVILSQNLKITVEKDVSLKVDEVFKLIMNQTDYAFFYEKDLFKNYPELFVKEGEINANELLQQSLLNGRYTLEVTENKVVLIKEAPEKIKKNLQQYEITGNIVDKDGMPLPFATVIEKGTVNGSQTDFDGNFTISVSDKNATLVISFMGYQTQEIPLNGKSKLNIVMAEDVSQLTEVVLTVQQKGQKKAIQEQINSNTIKNVVAEDRLQENPDANSVEAIGRLPGVSVTRAGGEGNGLVVRGLAPKYTAITINGVKMAGTSGDGRQTNISGISQYALQGAEVYKSLTADMEANSVAGTINLKIRETRQGLHANVMAQGGYNDLNKDYSNYRYQGEVGNRFFNDKLGAFVSVVTERVNRGTQTMSSTYQTELNTDTENLDFLTSGTNLNLVTRTNIRESAMLTLDYKLDCITKLGYYAMYNRSNSGGGTQTKKYSSNGSGSISYNFSHNTNRVNKIFQTALNGVSDWGGLKLEYGVSLSSARTDDPTSRSWAYYAPQAADLVADGIVFDRETRKNLDPTDVPLFYDDNQENINSFVLSSVGVSSEFMTDNNLDTYLNANIPFKIGDKTKGVIKTGYAYRKKERLRDVTSGGTNVVPNQFFRADILAAENLPWIVEDPVSENIIAENMPNGYVDNFLDGNYIFGHTFDFDRLNQITETWDNISRYWYSQGQSVWSEIYPKEKLGYAQHISSSTLNDQDVEEIYHAGYVMAELNIGDWLMFLPGVRYEKTNTTMNGFSAFQPTYAGPIYDPIPGIDSTATRANDFILPMIHLRISPKKWFYTHLAYTETLNRPGLHQISPNSWPNTGYQPFAYTSKSPGLEVEEWKNLDAQLTFHNQRLGLLSISGFYKTVNNKIWDRSYNRIKGDPLIDPFPDTSIVRVNMPENHPNEITLKGFELDLQTSLGYLSNIFKYFTMSANYTFTDSQTFYPISKIEDIIIPNPNGGRPIVETIRIDSLVSGPMNSAPKHIMNASLGFNKKGTNVWMSYQYTGGILQSTHPQFQEMDILKREYYRLDLQVSQKLYGKLKGFQLIGNFANLNNITESKNYRGLTNKPTSQENYGWTVDLGLRYSF
jgi:TonB-dependent receptor